MFKHEDLDDIRIEEAPLLIGARAKYPYSDRIAKLLTRTSRFGDEFKLYEKVGDYIYVPRNICTPNSSTVDKRTTGSKCGFVSKIKPRNEEQERVFNECLRLLKQDENFILRAGTGTGKSVVGLYLAAKINRPTLVVVPETTLMDQWVERAHQFYDIPKNRIGIIQQNSYDYKGKWLVVGMLQSLALKEDYPRAMYDYFGFIIYDEVHKASGDELSRACSLFSAKLRLGLSATPDRPDGKELVIQAHIGPIKVVSDDTPLGFKVVRYHSTWNCPRRRVVEHGYESWERIHHTPGKCGHIINSVAKHELTNKRIARWIKKCYDKGRNIVVFSDRLEHLDNLMTLAAREGVPSKDMAKYIGGSSKEQIRKAKSKRVVFGTYQKLGTGVDVAHWDTCFLCTPRANVKQFVGRIVREYEGKLTPTVFDFLFDDSPVFKNYGTARLKYYNSVNAPIKEIK